jgi:hypothetical protein
MHMGRSYSCCRTYEIRHFNLNILGAPNYEHFTKTTITFAHGRL